MRWLPRSLPGRVFALYAATLVGVIACGLALFLWQQVQRQVADARHDAQALLELVVPVLRDNAVIGDYDTINRQLHHLAWHSAIDVAEFRDPAGGVLQADGREKPAQGPQWLSRWVAERLGQPAQTVTAGGKDYGELRLTLAAPAIATQLSEQAAWAALLAAAGVIGGLALIQPPLRRWLGQLERIGELGQGLEGGRQLARRAMNSDAPVEFRRTFEVLDRAATSLQEQREQAAATLQAIDDAVLACGNDGRVMLANEAARRLLMREQSAILGQDVTDLLPALAKAGPEEPRADGLRQRRELHWHDPAGRLHVLDINLSPILDPLGVRLGQVLACRDLTEQHRRDQAMSQLHAARDAALASLRSALESSAGGGAEDAAATHGSSLADIEAVSLGVSRLVTRLHEHGEQLDAIFALSPDGFVSFDAERRVRYCSPGFAALTGLAAEAVRGLDEDAFIQQLRACCCGPNDAARLAQLRQPQPAGRRLMVTLDPPGRRVVELALKASCAGAVSQVLHLRDVTRETEVERMKSEFVATAAHELRTPMVGIYGYSELLVRRELPPDRQKVLLGRIHRQCEVMVAILNEMLDLARIEARQGSDFVFATVELRDVIEMALADFEPPPERAAPLRPGAAPAAPVRADATKLQRALRNLLSNAYKYSPAGGDVVVRVVVDPDGGRCGVQVVDHGIGMTPEQLARVGERFYRADESGTVLGTGLGMSLVREIVALHDGSIELQSAPGRGTTATLWVPQVRVPGAGGRYMPAAEAVALQD